MSEKSEDQGPNVGLFATCLVDLMRPSVGFAAVRLLEAAGCRVSVPAAQTCCGQPAYNSGDDADTKPLARMVIDTFEEFDFVIVPSGSCAGMIKCHYPELFADEPKMAARASVLSEKTYELVSFLSDVVGFGDLQSSYSGVATYHDACSGLRELGIKEQPRALLDKVTDLTLKEGQEAETCCGFGGLFCVKYPGISERMADEKIDDIVATGADTVLAGDMGCLLNIAGRLKRRGIAVKVRHVAEILAGSGDGPAIGDGADGQ
jgi:L-lactate dehydrogenase complex protein LldE